MRILLIQNENSGSAEEADAASILGEHGDQVLVEDISRAAGWAREEPPAELADVGRVVVSGGDGSIGCAALLAHRLGVPLGVVPAGTANDFARAMELPTEHEEAARLAATGSKLRDVDLALIDGMPFVNIASFGLAPDAAEHAHGLKPRLRAFAYPFGAALAAARTRPVSVVARVDERVAWAGKAWQAMVANSGAFGGWASTGNVDHGDGKLDLIIVPAGRGSHRLAIDAAALMRGELAEREGVVHHRGARIEMTLHRAPRVVVDGEIVGVDDRHVVASTVPGPVRVVVG